MEKFHENTLGWLKDRNVTKIELKYVYFPTNFPKVVEQLFCYLYSIIALIFDFLQIHFYLDHSKSHTCSQVYNIIVIHCITLLLLLCFTIATRNNIVWKLARDYCLCYCNDFSLVPDSTECTKIFATEKCSTLFVSPKIK